MDAELIRREPLGNGFFACVSAHHTFGTDAVLLAHFAAARRQDRLVDLGTGCGIIPLLMLRDGLLSSAAGVDLSPEAVQLAARARDEQSLERFSVLECDLNELAGRLPFGQYTLVTCNPPYKAPDGGLKNPDPVAAAARHEITCTLRDVVSAASRLLQTSGRFCVCHRPERLPELFSLMSEYRLAPKRLRLVCQRPGEEPWLILAEGRRCGRPGLRIEPPLFVEENGDFSPEMKKIYGSYREVRNAGETVCGRDADRESGGFEPPRG